MQDARIAEAFEIVNAGAVGGACDTRQSTRERGSAREFKKIPAADCHAMSPRLSASDPIRLNRIGNLISLLEHDLFGKPVPTFPDHAPGSTYLERLPGLFFTVGLEDRSLGQRLGFLRRGYRLIEVALVG